MNFAAWGWEQWAIIGLYALGVLLVTFLNGHERTGKYNAGITCIETFVVLVILWSGGFFS